MWSQIAFGGLWVMVGVSSREINEYEGMNEKDVLLLLLLAAFSACIRDGRRMKRGTEWLWEDLYEGQSRKYGCFGV